MNHLLYYSTNSYLAFYLSEYFYRGKHFVWCSPVFNPASLDNLDIRRKIPPSSSPYKIYINFKEDVDNYDLHSSKINENKSGLKRGALINYRNEVIDADELARINQIIDTAELFLFRPLIYLIPVQLVDSKIKEVPVDTAANPLSLEYQILDLSENEFEIIEF